MSIKNSKLKMKSDNYYNNVTTTLSISIYSVDISSFNRFMKVTTSQNPAKKPL